MYNMHIHIYEQAYTHTHKCIEIKHLGNYPFKI